MSYQAGIKKVTLYENKSLEFVYYDPADFTKITDITSTGEIIEIENESLPDLDIKHSLGGQGLLLFDYKMEFYILDYSIPNLETIRKLKESIYGWKFLIEYYDGTERFYNVPLYCRDSSINPHKEFSNKIELKTMIPTKEGFYVLFTAGALDDVYRADTTIITADSDQISADYSL